MRMVTSKKIRKANRHFFEESGIRSDRSTNHHPFLVLRQTKTRIKVDLVKKVQDLLKMPDNTRIMAQWEGVNRSDFYFFKVSDLKKHIQEYPKQPKQKI